MKKLFIPLLFAGASIIGVTAQTAKLPYTVRTVDSRNTAKRTEIILPQVKGYNLYKADFHIHTVYSDGQVSPAGRVYEAWHDGLDIIAITDHYGDHKGIRRFFKVTAPYNEDGKPTKYTMVNAKNPLRVDFNAILNEATTYCKKKVWDMLIIKGCEMARSKIGHFNALFVTDLNTLYNPDLKEAFRNVHKQGGIVMFNHPGNVSKLDVAWHESVRNERLIDAVEISNGYNIYPYMINRCNEDKLIMLSGTDLHGPASYPYQGAGTFRTMTFVLAKELTEKAVKEAVLERRTIVYSGGTLIGDKEWLGELLNASIDCRLTKVNDKAKNRIFVLTNLSSLTYYLRIGKTTYKLEPFKSTTVTLGKNKKTGKYIAPKFVVENMWVADYKHPTIEMKIDK